MEKVKIVRVGQADPKMTNIGHHEIGLNRGFIYVWFSDIHDVRTAEEALEIAERIVESLNQEHD